MDNRYQVDRQARLFGGDAPWDELHSALEDLPEPIGPEVMKDLARETHLGLGKLVLDNLETQFPGLWFQFHQG